MHPQKLTFKYQFNIPDSEGNTAIIKACKANNKRLVDAILHY